MTSTNPYQIIDDDDEGFDWEAAAREIDSACQVTNPSTSNIAKKGSKNEQKTGTSRQSTLDKFVGKKETPRPQLQNEDIGERHRDFSEANEGVRYIEIDAEAAKTWIYPVNVPLRDYQFTITKSALFSNTLVALPTGLGKTLIAAVVMYNYYRWFPEGKIVFAAPSRPLVMQQIEACHNIVGIPQEWTIDMTGQLSPAKRAGFWKTKRVFFVTPQVLEKDIHSGTCLVKNLVCLVIDEAHRAMGNYSYCEAVRELKAVPVQLRILALTATPGSKQQTVQQVIDNLHISTLEYRSESDHDIISYVHNRKLELIQVAMGQDAEEINSTILEVICPIVARLSGIGVLQYRDYRTLSPCELLEIREKFRQAPPPNLSHVNYGDVEGYFGVLISLYYIHKLLSSHGIRPAYEMLEKKLKQGFFAKFMSKNEVFMKARLLMQQSLSRGAPSPKLSKMMEVLLEHFKANDPQNSRVIIFSNYRESVRDIMDALSNTCEVRAAQFIGQSSGKAMKGQSQKVQQAVLEKFRSGAYNVIVATSIGEEGLDIMEVDLVISFDANVSPLRMIQRMGRTGRKHDGRVVVLACEGTELKGYLRKQAKGKAISKHMHNGGINSFTFHPSPRMIPHVYKPEVKFVKLSIEKFVPREKKVKDDSPQIPAFNYKLSAAETILLARYFNTNGAKTWRPSLIAFPHFQTFPSRVQKVRHSCRTTMLIETMQHLQGQSSMPGDSKTSNLKDGMCLGNSNPIEITELDKAGKDNNSCSRNTIERNIVSENCLKLKSCCLDIQTEDFGDLTKQDNVNNTFEELRSSRTSCLKNDAVLSGFCDLDKHQEESFKNDDTIPETPNAKRSMSNVGDSVKEMPNTVEIKTSLLQADACSNDTRDCEFSPRLTNLLKSGVVPESPIDKSGGISINMFVIPDCISPVQLLPEQQVSSLSPGENEKVITDSGTGGNVCISPVDPETQTPLLKLKNCVISRGRVFLSPSVEDGQTLVANHTSHSFSEESQLECGEMSASVKPVCKFKRLRKADVTGSKMNRKRGSFVPTEYIVKSSTSNPTRNKQGQGERKLSHDVRLFIEEEAEVSSEADVSNEDDNDVDDEDENSLNSFIDDRMNPTATSQPEASRTDMMAIYRRSLLSQTPMGGRFNFSPTFSSDSVTPMTTISEAQDSSVDVVTHFQKPLIEPLNQSVSRTLESFHINQITTEAAPSSSSPTGTKIEMQSRKRKLTFSRSGHFPRINLEQKFAVQSKKESIDASGIRDVLFDDDIYDSIDLDELEAQATSLLKQKLDFSSQKQDTVSQSQSQNLNLLSSPSFDLGI